MVRRRTYSVSVPTLIFRNLTRYPLESKSGNVRQDFEANWTVLLPHPVGIFRRAIGRIGAPQKCDPSACRWAVRQRTRTPTTRPHSLLLPLASAPKALNFGGLGGRTPGRRILKRCYRPARNPRCTVNRQDAKKERKSTKHNPKGMDNKGDTLFAVFIRVIRGSSLLFLGVLAVPFCQGRRLVLHL
jgi:hypothetical protein